MDGLEAIEFIEEIEKEEKEGKKFDHGSESLYKKLNKKNIKKIDVYSKN